MSKVPFCCIMMFVLSVCMCAVGQGYSTPLSGSNPLQRMWSEIPDGAEIVCKLYSWPGDDRLCDGYSGSNGPRELRVYETISGQILAFEDFGAYCQGDSEYGVCGYFDLQGNLVMRYEGGNMYTSELYTLFDKGRFVHFYEVPSAYDSPTLLELDSNAVKAQTSSAVRHLVDAMHSELTGRHKNLVDFALTLSGEDLEEAQAQIAEIAHALTNGPKLSSYSLRLPSSEELSEEPQLFLAGEHLALFVRPDFNAEVLGTLSYYKCCLNLLEYGDFVESSYSPKDQWVKVRYQYDEDATIEAWILKSGLQRSFLTR